MKEHPKMEFPNAFEDLVTNENLEAIVAGLDIQSEDEILTICGSGDQAFAFAEKVNRITIVDLRKKQIEFFGYRKNLLKTKDYLEFLDPHKLPRDEQDLESLKFRKRYFNLERLEKIRSKLENLEINKKDEKNIFELNLGKEKFDKIYLSNALSYGIPPSLIDSSREKLLRVSKLISNNGLIYISDYDTCFLKEKYKIKNLVINKRLTKKSMELQSKMKEWKWIPAVFQKIYN